MADIFTAMGINTKGGEFTFPEPKYIDLTAKSNILVQLQTNFHLPVSDDYLYKTFGIEKPQNYNEMKKQIEEEHLLQQMLSSPGMQFQQDDENQGEDPDKPKPQKTTVSTSRQPGERQRVGASAGIQPDQKKGKRTIKGILHDFFAHAPRDRGAVLEW